MLPLLTLLLQDDDVAAPFGTFMEAVPHWGFIIIHSVLILVGWLLARKTHNKGFLLFVLAEFAYITYHLGATHFLFAHTIAEVCDALALVFIAIGYARLAAAPARGAGVPLVAGTAQDG